ncbi:MAG: Clp protease N-terminal domain-containing protein, partial [Pseudomonadota bacterium]|nr:Clp protease N-terminal domain-containing protein [Pseudomonadota bacterium]
MDKLTRSLQAAVGEAQSLAIGRDHPFIEPLHLLKAMLDPAGSASRALLLAAGAAVEPLQAAVDAALGAMATVSGSEDIHVSQETQRLLNRADKLSQQAGDTYLSTDAVLLAMLESKSTAS